MAKRLAYEPTDRGTLLTSADSIDSPSIAVQEMACDWQIIDDLMGGTETMRLAGRRWLPQRIREPNAFYDRRLQSSFLHEALADTVESTASKPFSKPLTWNGEMPPDLVEWWKNVTGGGETANSFAKRVMTSAARYGLAHVLVDYPVTRTVDEAGNETEVVQTLADERELQVRPFCTLVTAPQILGWEEETTGGVTRLASVRFWEWHTRRVGAYGEEKIKRIRVYTKDTWEIHEQEPNPDKGKRGEKPMRWVIVDSGINSLGEVPLRTYYTEREDFMVARPPFLDLAWLNVEHWQSSSLQRNILDVGRVPILFKRGFTDSENEASNQIGANAAFVSSNKDSDVRWVEPTGSAIAAGERDGQRIREQMEIHGLQPWLQRLSGAPATGIASNDAKMICQVQSWAQDLGMFMTEVVKLAAGWQKKEVPEDFQVKVHDEFGIGLFGQQRADRLIVMRRDRQIRHQTFLEEMKRLGDLPEGLNVEQEVEDIKAEAPAMGSLLPDMPGQDPENPDDEEVDEDIDQDDPPAGKPKPRGGRPPFFAR
jgi:hypothetical protein